MNDTKVCRDQEERPWHSGRMAVSKLFSEPTQHAQFKQRVISVAVKTSFYEAGPSIPPEVKCHGKTERDGSLPDR